MVHAVGVGLTAIGAVRLCHCKAQITVSLCTVAKNRRSPFCGIRFGGQGMSVLGESLQGCKVIAVLAGTHHYLCRHRSATAIACGVGELELAQCRGLGNLHLKVRCLSGSSAPVGHIIRTGISVQQVLQAALVLSVVVGQAEYTAGVGGERSLAHCHSAYQRNQFLCLLHKIFQLSKHQVVLIHAGGCQIPPRTVVVGSSMVPSHYIAAAITVQRHLVLLGLALQCP